MVCQAIQQRAGQPFRAQHLGPFGERQIAGDQGRRSFLPLAEDFEKHFGAAFDSGTNPSSSTMSNSCLASCF